MLTIYIFFLSKDFFFKVRIKILKNGRQKIRVKIRNLLLKMEELVAMQWLFLFYKVKFPILQTYSNFMTIQRHFKETVNNMFKIFAQTYKKLSIIWLLVFMKKN